MSGQYLPLHRLDGPDQAFAGNGVGKEKGAPAETGRPEGIAMFDVAQDEPSPKTNSRHRSKTIAAPPPIPAVRPRSPTELTGAGYRLRDRIAMTSDAWIAVRDNPRQRDTERHAKRAAHLRTPDPIHAIVSMAELPDGTRYKLDGHTRALLWSKGEVTGPEAVFVDVFACDSIAAVLSLYSKFDAKVAVETAADQITGAAREAGLVFDTPMLRSGHYGSAVKRLFALTTRTWGMSWGEADFTSAAVRYYANELRILDTLCIQPKSFPSGVVMAGLATLRRRGMAGLPFWQTYSEGGGVKADGEMDAVQALHEAVMAVKARKVRSGGQDQQMGLLGKGILAHDAYRSSYMYTVGRGLGNMGEPVLKQYLRHGLED